MPPVACREYPTPHVQSLTKAIAPVTPTWRAVPLLCAGATPRSGPALVGRAQTRESWELALHAALSSHDLPGFRVLRGLTLPWGLRVGRLCEKSLGGCKWSRPVSPLGLVTMKTEGRSHPHLGVGCRRCPQDTVPTGPSCALTVCPRWARPQRLMMVTPEFPSLVLASETPALPEQVLQPATNKSALSPVGHVCSCLSSWAVAAEARAAPGMAQPQASGPGPGPQAAPAACPCVL